MPSRRLARVGAISAMERAQLERRDRVHATQFDRAVVFDGVLDRLQADRLDRAGMRAG